MAVEFEQYLWAQKFVNFTEEDHAHLRGLQPLIETHGPKITNKFYAIIGAHPELASFLEGRLDGLKRTHNAYMKQLVAGEYGESYFDSRVRVGMVHVVQGIKPHWVEAVMTIIRTEVLELISLNFEDPKERAAKTTAFVKICDLDAMVINFAYGEDRLDRISKFTGMSRRLIENIINLPAKKK